MTAPLPAPAATANKVIAAHGPASFCWSSVVLSLLSLPESLTTRASASGPAWPDVFGVGNGYSVRWPLGQQLSVGIASSQSVPRHPCGFGVW